MKIHVFHRLRQKPGVLAPRRYFLGVMIEPHKWCCMVTISVWDRYFYCQVIYKG